MKIIHTLTALFILLFAAIADTAAQQRVISRQSVMFETSDRAATLLEAAGKAVKDGRFAAGCKAYVDILDNYYEDIVEFEDGQYKSAAQLAEEALLELPATTREFLEKLVAGRIPSLDEWKTLRQLRAGLLEIHRVFFWTNAGCKAREMLGDLALESGRPLTAAYYYKAALPWAEAHRTNGLRSKLVTAYTLAGKPGRAENTARKLAAARAGEPVLAGGRVLKASELIAGFAKNNKFVSPAKSKPKWVPFSLPLKRYIPPLSIDRRYRNQPQFHYSAYVPSELSCLRPVIAAGKIIIPTAIGLRAYNTSDLTPAWRYPEKQSRMRKGIQRRAGVVDPDIRPPCIVGNAVIAAYDSGRGALELAALNPATGSLIWKIDYRSPTFKRLISSHRSVSASVAVDDMIVMASVNLVTGSRFNDFHLFAIDSRGRLAWDKRIFSFYRGWSKSAMFTPNSAPELLAIDGVVIATNAQGTITAVEGRTGRILWSVIYPSASPQRFIFAPAENAMSNLLFSLAGVETGDGRAAVLSPDMSKTLIIDPVSGLWKNFPQISRASRSFLGHVVGDKLIYLDNGLSAYHERKGTRLWKHGGAVRGLPEVIGKAVFLPGKDVRIFDAETGTEQETIENVMPLGVNYNLVAGDGKLFAVSPRGLGIVAKNMARLVRSAERSAVSPEFSLIRQELDKGNLAGAEKLLKKGDTKRLMKIAPGVRISARSILALIKSELTQQARKRQMALKWSTSTSSKPAASPSTKPMKILPPSFESMSLWEELPIATPLNIITMDNCAAVINTRGLALIDSDGKILYKREFSPTATQFLTDGPVLIASTLDTIHLIDSQTGKARSVKIGRPKGRPYRAAFMITSQGYLHVSITKNYTYINLIDKSTNKTRWSRTIKGEMLLPRINMGRPPYLWNDGRLISLIRPYPFGIERVNLHNGKDAGSVKLGDKKSKLLLNWTKPKRRQPALYENAIYKLDKRLFLGLGRALRPKDKKKRVPGIGLFDITAGKMLWAMGIPKGYNTSSLPTEAFLAGEGVVLIMPHGQILAFSIKTGRIIYNLASEKGYSLKVIEKEGKYAYLLKMTAQQAKTEDILKIDLHAGKVLWRWENKTTGILWPAGSHPQGSLVVGRARGVSFEATQPTLGGLVFDKMECVVLNRNDGAPDLVRTIDNSPKDIGITALPAAMVTDKRDKIFGIFYGRAFKMDIGILGRK